VSRTTPLPRPADRRRQDDPGYGGVGKEQTTDLEAEIYPPTLGGSEKWRRRTERMGRGFVSSTWHEPRAHRRSSENRTSHSENENDGTDDEHHHHHHGATDTISVPVQDGLPSPLGNGEFRRTASPCTISWRRRSRSRWNTTTGVAAGI